MTRTAEPPDERPAPALERELGRLLPGLSRLELARLVAHLEPVTVPGGETVFRQGDPGRDLYLVLDGLLEAVVASDDGATAMPVGRFEAGDAFGEMALVTDAPRSATVRALEDTRLVRLPRDRFLELARLDPRITLLVATRLSERLRSANQARLLSERTAQAAVERALARLPDDRRSLVIDASVLEEATPEGLGALFGPGAGQVAEDLAALGADRDAGAGTGPVPRLLRARLRRPRAPGPRLERDCLLRGRAVYRPARGGARARPGRWRRPGPGARGRAPLATRFVLGVALLSVLARLVLEQDLCVLLAALILVPLAPGMGVDPWVVMMAVLATSVAWILPTQTQSFLVALSASEGRLFSMPDAQRFALAYTALVLLGLALSLGYWRLLGLP